MYKYCNKFALFHDNGDNKITIYGDFMNVKSDFIGIFDPGWHLVYFFPKIALRTFSEIVECVNEIVLNQYVGKVTVCEQFGDEIMALYRKMEEGGVFD